MSNPYQDSVVADEVPAEAATISDFTTVRPPLVGERQPETFRDVLAALATLFFFSLVGGVTLAGSGFFVAFGDVVSLVVVGAIWLGTLATDTPLTGHYSKWHWPRAFWRYPVFIKINAVITA